jgi:hypothetical protein
MRTKTGDTFHPVLASALRKAHVQKVNDLLQIVMSDLTALQLMIQSGQHTAYFPSHIF